MQYIKKAAGRFECNDGWIGFSHEMSVEKTQTVPYQNLK